MTYMNPMEIERRMYCCTGMKRARSKWKMVMEEEEELFHQTKNNKQKADDESCALKIIILVGTISNFEIGGAQFMEA